MPRNSRPQRPWGIILQAAVLILGLAVAWGRLDARYQDLQRQIERLSTTCATESTQQAHLSWIKSLSEATDRRLSALEERDDDRH